MVFNHAPELVQGWTQPPRDLAGRLDKVKPFGGTAIYDAVHPDGAAASTRAAPALRPRHHLRRRGHGQRRRLQEALAALNRTDAFVYAIAIDAPAGPPSTAGSRPTRCARLPARTAGTRPSSTDPGPAGRDRAHRQRAEPPVHARLCSTARRRTASTTCCASARTTAPSCALAPRLLRRGQGGAVRRDVAPAWRVLRACLVGGILPARLQWKTTCWRPAERYRSGRNGVASKASCRVSGTWVRIPPSPPTLNN